MLNLTALKKLINKTFPDCGINKNREITRLIFEICRRENISPSEIIQPLKNNKFPIIKDALAKRRFPYASSSQKSLDLYLPELEIDAGNKARLGAFRFYPKNVYFDQKSQNSCLLKRFRAAFPKAGFHLIGRLKDYFRCSKYGIKDYNQRMDNFFIVSEEYDFFKRCPCTKSAVCCGYQVLNIGYGCGYECVYCFLQEYQNFPGVILPANLEDFFKQIHKIKQIKGIFPYARIGSGEFTDSLIFDHVTGFSSLIVDFFRQYPKVYFEFKTKSANIDNLVKLKPSKNIVISWSLNPQNVIDKNEFYSASLQERIKAAVSCQEAGFKLGFHFDPVIFYEGWEKDYQKTVNYLFDSLRKDSIVWISLGTFRFSPALKKIIENRFPDNIILNGELILGFDRKLRYPGKLRDIIYRKMIGWIKKRSPQTHIYLCMEEGVIWKSSGLNCSGQI